MQNSGDYDEIYIMIADAQALDRQFGTSRESKTNIMNVALDYLA